MDGKTRLDVTLNRVLAFARANEREARASYRRKIEYIRSAAFILRSRVNNGYGTAEDDEELLQECEAALAAHEAGEEINFITDDDPPIPPPLPAVGAGIEVRKQAMPIHGYNPGGMGGVYWLADHELPIASMVPQPDDVVEYEGNLYTVIDEVRYLRLIPCEGPDKSREPSSFTRVVHVNFQPASVGIGEWAEPEDGRP